MHEPVMVGDVLELLITDTGTTYVDLNLGGGGHGEAICEALSGRPFRYVGVDLDPAARIRAAERLARFGDRVTLLAGNHRDFPGLLDEIGLHEVDGILFDLGFSSDQLDDAGRGFSFDQRGPLDMRYHDAAPTAAAILESASEHDLALAFKRYGDLRGANRLARAIGRERRTAPVATTEALCHLIDRELRPAFSRRRKVFSQVFQALRVMVNDEVRSFEVALEQCPDRLRPGGVLVVLAYESVTDRVTKHFFRPPNEPRDMYGNPLRPAIFEPLTRGARRPTEEEVEQNPRARSARLRAGRKIAAAPEDPNRGRAGAADQPDGEAAA
jgi:16S rRNA (cytosine1402-N4)-methyltransferase